MEKSLSLDIHKSKQRNLSSKVLLLFAFLFFHNLSSQIYVKDSSLLTITDAAFVSSSSQNPIPTKIHISGNVIVTNIDAFSNAEIVEIRNSVLPKHRITHSVKPIILNETKDKKIVKVQKEPIYKFENNHNQTVLLISCGLLNASGIMANPHNSVGILPFSENTFNPKIFYTYERTFHSEKNYEEAKPFGYKVRPPPFVLL